MSNNELEVKVAADSLARIKAADDDALLASEAFAYGVFDKYLAAKVNDINRRINERFRTTGDTASTAAIADPGKPLA